jgi:hypothetical protein
MGMTVLPFDEILEYLRTLGQRHQDVRTAVVALPSAFTAPDAAAYPVLLVEPDPFISEAGPGCDSYRFAVQLLVRPERSDAQANPALVAEAKLLADEVRQQLDDDGVLLQVKDVTFLLLYNDADDGSASGVRLEFAVTVAKMADRNTNRLKFAPRA